MRASSNQLADAQLAEAQLADAQLAELQLAEAQLADAQLADAQLAEAQLACVQDGFAATASFQAAVSKANVPVEGSGLTKASRLSFAFAGAQAAGGSRPVDLADAGTEARALEVVGGLISAPLTRSGVQSGCRARICAAAPATTGAAKEVPDIHM